MLSLTRGREIATFIKGRNKSKKIFLYGENNFNKNQIAEVIIPQNKKFSLVSRSWIKDKKLSNKEIEELKNGVNEDLRISQISEPLQQTYEELIRLIDDKLKTEMDFNDIENIHLFPIPQKYSERIYIPAPSGSGKSTFIGDYLKQIRIKYPKRKIVVFSRVPYDKPIDRFSNLTRIVLDYEKFIEEPLAVEDFKNNILIFDDIDTILNKSLVKYLRNFRDDVLEVGRHYGITAISTSHIIMNFSATRTLINEAQAVVLFPRGSSFQQVKGFLERYLGFSNQQIEFIKNLPSRWLFIWKEYPKYLIYDKGVILW